MSGDEIEKCFKVGNITKCIDGSITLWDSGLDECEDMLASRFSESVELGKYYVRYTDGTIDCLNFDPRAFSDEANPPEPETSTEATEDECDECRGPFEDGSIHLGESGNLVCRPCKEKITLSFPTPTSTPSPASGPLPWRLKLAHEWWCNYGSNLYSYQHAFDYADAMIKHYNNQGDSDEG